MPLRGGWFVIKNIFACSVCGQVPRMFWTFGGGWWSTWEDDHQICPGCSLWLCKEFGVMCSMEVRS